MQPTRDSNQKHRRGFSLKTEPHWLPTVAAVEGVSCQQTPVLMPRTEDAKRHVEVKERLPFHLSPFTQTLRA
eukprot:3023845-Amphidinium_carterae.2